MTHQPLLFAEAPLMPPGLVYAPNLLDAAEQAGLVAQIGQLPFKPFDFHGYIGRRKVISFGWTYDYDSRKVGQSQPMPDFLLPLRERAGGFAGIQPETLRQVLINEYEAGAGVGWHRDRPMFGDVIGISLLSACRFRFRRAEGEGWERRNLTVEPGSAYLMRGPARDEWEHSVPPVEAHRYSVTFRTLRDQGGIG